MIRAELLENDEGALVGFKIKGHAGYGQAGQDLVCAGVSTLVQSVEEALERFLSAPPQVSTGPGEGTRSREREDFCVSVRLPEHLDSNDWRTAEIVLGILEIGLQMCASEYGKYIALRRCRDDSGKI